MVAYVDVVGLSSLATDHLIVPELMDALRAADLHNVRVVVGGIVPESEHAALIDAGVSHVLGPGTSRDEIVECVRECATAARRDAIEQAEV